ncbi:uncharacterized protein UDID_03534 [Ustilago sp. UG-2017a]|nr:uncharacterized protein UDID_03534 [Ustilago sp. UG-2017a]
MINLLHGNVMTLLSFLLIICTFEVASRPAGGYDDWSICQPLKYDFGGPNYSNAGFHWQDEHHVPAESASPSIPGLHWQENHPQSVGAAGIPIPGFTPRLLAPYSLSTSKHRLGTGSNPTTTSTPLQTRHLPEFRPAMEVSQFRTP